MSVCRIQILKFNTLLSAFLCIALSACNTSSDHDSFRFGQLQNVHGSLTYLADQQGLFRRQGLPYESIVLPAGPDIVTALKVSGDNGVDAGGLAATPIVTMIGAGDKPVILASMLYSSRSIKLVAAKSSGITGDPSTLRGKEIGVVRNTVGDIYLSKLLQKGHLTEADATIVDGRPADLVNLFASRHIEAAILWDPYAVQAVREITRRNPKSGAISLADDTIHPFTMFVVTTQSKLPTKQAAFEKLLRALIGAQAFVDKNPAQSEHLLETWMNLQPNDLHDFFSTSQFEVKINRAQTIQVLSEEMQWLKTTRPSTTVPAKLGAYIDSSLLQSIDPSRVTQ